MDTDEHGCEIFPERGSVSRSAVVLILTLKLLLVTDPRAAIRVYLCPSVVENK